MKKYFTSESVACGHPDKLADQISDALVDAYISIDPNAKCGIEVMIKDNHVVLGGEVTAEGNLDIDFLEIIKDVLIKAGATKEKGLDPESIDLINYIGKQSPEINHAVVKDDGSIGSGDQGIVFGYACNTTPNYMPLDLYIAKLLVNGVIEIDGLGSDAKSQVTLFLENEEFKIDSILISTMHRKDISLDKVRTIVNEFILKTLDEYNLTKYLTKDTKIHINTAGSWYVGYSYSDAGLVGRKIVCDTFGGCNGKIPVGGGSLSSKDGSKVDRSGPMACRYIAKNIVVASGYAEVHVGLSYMIGVADPSSIRITYKKDIWDDTEHYFTEEMINVIKQIFPLAPKAIIDKFDLRRPIYYNLAKNGHFGIDSYSWEQLDKVDELNTRIIF